MALDYPINLISASRIRCMDNRGYRAIAYCIEIDGYFLWLTLNRSHRSIYSPLFYFIIPLLN